MDNGLEHAIWAHFDAISRIPRISGHEERISAWLIQFGETHQLDTIRDDVGNVLIRKKASPGYENRKPVILQSHMDMVAAKDPTSRHDFLLDPISYYRDENWIRSRGTTLGADDGIGVAAALAILSDDTIQHPPLECLFTVDEESGMTGAKALREDWLKGKILINLDSEDEGELFIGCAGGMDTTAVFKKEMQPLKGDFVAFTVTLTGLSGGHSGDEIHKGHGNAIKLIDRLLWLLDSEVPLKLIEAEGGTLRNAIPPEARGTFAVPKSQGAKVRNIFEDYVKTVAAEYRNTDPGMNVVLKEIALPGQCFTDQLKDNLIRSLYACPHGVYAWSKSVPGLVETSTNMALLRCGDDTVTVGTNQRSAVDSARKDLSDMVSSVFLLAGADITQDGNYPGWEPNPDSDVLRITEKSYEQLFGEKPAVRAIHAGLECGLFLEKYPELDMISFGPTIRGAHTPEERLDIKSTGKFWDLLLDVLKEMSEND